MFLEQVLEKLSNQSESAYFIEFRTSESVDFVSRKSQFSSKVKGVKQSQRSQASWLGMS